MGRTAAASNRGRLKQREPIAYDSRIHGRTDDLDLLTDEQVEELDNVDPNNLGDHDDQAVVLLRDRLLFRIKEGRSQLKQVQEKSERKKISWEIGDVEDALSSVEDELAIRGDRAAIHALKLDDPAEYALQLEVRQATRFCKEAREELNKAADDLRPDSRKLLKRQKARLKAAEEKLAERQRTYQEGRDKAKKRKEEAEAKRAAQARDEVEEIDDEVDIYEYEDYTQICELDSEELPHLLPAADAEIQRLRDSIKHAPEEHSLRKQLKRAKAIRRKIQEVVDDRIMRAKQGSIVKNGQTNVVHEATSDGKEKPTTSPSGRRNPGRVLYTEYRGFFTLVFEWGVLVVRGAIAEAKAANTGDGKKMVKGLENATGNLVLALARLVYWSEPDKKRAAPRADVRHRAQDKDGTWWLVHAPAVLGRQVGLTKKAALIALRKLADLGVIEIKNRKDLHLVESTASINYGPNASFVRVRWEIVEEYVMSHMKKDPPRRSGKKKG